MHIALWCVVLIRHQYVCVLSSTGDVLEMSVVRSVGGVCDMCMCKTRVVNNKSTNNHLNCGKYIIKYKEIFFLNKKIW